MWLRRAGRGAAALTLGALAAAVVTGCEAPESGPYGRAGSAEPYPSRCVDKTVEALLAMEDPPVPAERPVDDPHDLLMYDRLTYRISGEDFLWYALDRYVAPERVPEEYRFPEEPELEGTDPLTGVMFEAMWEMDCLPAETLDEITEYIGTGRVPAGRD